LTPAKFIIACAAFDAYYVEATRLVFVKYHSIVGFSLLPFFFVQLSSQMTGEVEGVDVCLNVRVTFEIGFLKMEVLINQELSISFSAVALITSSNLSSEKAIIIRIVHPRRISSVS
jgi:hypothetical protein